ncbi:MAG: hypothetical protein A3J29_15750 [Acidobacteria bacterium RIFCSPLOWO2_12_FULL_67_14b]|nr:MAG: hypothetical protein A3J29_15750 [Acidobacteria bacterium RIFCSPLOWO2_12_FULL_67_14b]
MAERHFLLAGDEMPIRRRDELRDGIGFWFRCGGRLDGSWQRLGDDPGDFGARAGHASRQQGSASEYER